MNVTCYRSGDERAIVELWNRCLPSDSITPERFRRLVLLDANFDPEGVRLAFDGEALVGAMYVVRRRLPMIDTDLEPDRAWMPWFFVDPAFRGQGVGSRLLEGALGFARKNGRKQLYFAAYAPNYIVPGIDPVAYPQGLAFLRRHGFDMLYSPVAMDMALANLEAPEDVRALKERRAAEGYTFRSAGDEDIHELIEFAARTFNPDWGRAVREGLLQSLRLEYISIVRNPMCRLVGFGLFGAYEGIRERFGPFGVDPAQRGTGLGKILLYDCLANMRAHGMHGAWFLWTGETTPAAFLYKKVGFRVTRRFHVLMKQL